MIWGQIKWGQLGAIVGLLFALVAVPGIGHSSTENAVRINELTWAGSTGSTLDEWIELYNSSEENINIGGWQLTKWGSGGDSLMLTIPANSSIPSQGYFLISNYPAAQSVLASEPELVNSAVSLSNTNLRIGLYEGDFSNPDNLVDMAGDGGVPPAGNNIIKASMERTAEGNGWQSSSLSLNMDEGRLDLATPASENSVPPAPAPIVTSVSPNQGTVGENLIVSAVVGEHFISNGIEVEIYKEDKVLAATEINVANESLIDHMVFNLEGTEPGDWSLRVRNQDGQAGELGEAITISPALIPDDLSSSVRINEVYPRPITGEEEYIELYNNGSRPVRLNHWQIDDVSGGGSNPYTLGTIEIPASSFVLLYKSESGVTLNDTGDSVRLIQPNGEVADSTTYGSSKAGSSWARFEGIFKWSLKPTPGSLNLLFEEEQDEKEVPVAIPVPVPGTTQSYPVGTLIIDEILPNPNGPDEFIEIFNPGTNPIPMAGWRLKDASGKSYALGSEITTQSLIPQVIPAKGWVVILSSQSKIFLNNNGGEMIELTDPSGKTSSKVSYPDKAPIGAAYVYFQNEWWWSQTPTPGLENKIEIAEVSGDAIEVVEPLRELPVTGSVPIRLAGMLCMGLAAAVILGWYRNEKRKSLSHNNRNTSSDF